VKIVGAGLRNVVVEAFDLCLNVLGVCRNILGVSRRSQKGGVERAEKAESYEEGHMGTT
jgi:hypothetical protein